MGLLVDGFDCLSLCRHIQYDSTSKMWTSCSLDGSREIKIALWLALSLFKKIMVMYWLFVVWLVYGSLAKRLALKDESTEGLECPLSL